jgi:hypothetical protein
MMGDGRALGVGGFALLAVGTLLLLLAVTLEAQTAPVEHAKGSKADAAKALNWRGRVAQTSSQSCLEQVGTVVGDERRRRERGQREDTVQGMGTEELAKAIAAQGGLGIARRIVRQVTAEDAAMDKGRRKSKVE